MPTRGHTHNGALWSHSCCPRPVSPPRTFAGSLGVDDAVTTGDRVAVGVVPAVGVAAVVGVTGAGFFCGMAGGAVFFGTPGAGELAAVGDGPATAAADVGDRTDAGDDAAGVVAAAVRCTAGEAVEAEGVAFAGFAVSAPGRVQDVAPVSVFQ